MSIPTMLIGSILTSILSRPNVAVDNAAASTVAGQIVSGVKADPNIAIVPIKSPFTSKINWVAGVGLVATVASLFGINFDPETQKAVILGITSITTVGIWVVKTFFTNSVTAASAGK